MTGRIAWLRENAVPKALEAARSREGALWSLPEDDDEAFAAVVMCDPTAHGVYVAWLLKMLARGGVRSEDLPRAMDTLALFHAAKRRLPQELRDIGRYASEAELHSAISDTSVLQGSVEVPDEIRRESSILYEGPEGCVAVPMSIAASKWWGKGTRWCTTQEWNFSSYTDNGDLYVVVASDGVRHQMHEASGQFCDSQDQMLSIPGIVDWVGERSWAMGVPAIRSAVWSILVSQFEEWSDLAPLKVGAALPPETIRRTFERMRWNVASKLRGYFLMAVSPNRDNRDFVGDLGLPAEVAAAAAPLQCALDGTMPPGVREQARSLPEVAAFMGGVHEETPSGSPVRVFRILTEEAALAWSEMYPETSSQSVRDAFRTGSPLHVLVGLRGRAPCAVAVASLTYSPPIPSPFDDDRSDALQSLHVFLSRFMDEDPAARAALADLSRRIQDILVLRDVWTERAVPDDADRVKGAVDRVAEAGLRELASGADGWRVRLSTTPQASGALLLRSYGPYGTGGRPLAHAARKAVMEAFGAARDTLRPVFDDDDPPGFSADWWKELKGSVVEVRDPDGTLWVLVRPHVQEETPGVRHVVPSAVLPVLNGGVPLDAVKALLSGRNNRLLGVETAHWPELRPCGFAEFIEARPWLRTVPGIPMLAALSAAMNGDSDGARRIGAEPTEEEFRMAASVDPLSVLEGVYGPPPEAVRQASLEKSVWGPAVIQRRSPGKLNPLRSGDGWAAYALRDAAVAEVMDVLHPSEAWRLRHVLPGSYSGTTLRIGGELLLSLRAGAMVVQSERSGNGLTGTLLTLTSGRTSEHRAVDAEPGMFREGLARLAAVRLLPDYLHRGSIGLHPVLHPGEGGLRADDLVALYGEPLHDLKTVMRALMESHHAPLALVREAIRSRPGLLAALPFVPDVIADAAVEDLAAYLAEGSWSSGFPQVSSLESVVSLIGEVGRGRADTRKSLVLSRLLVGHLTTQQPVVQSYLDALGPDLQERLMEAVGNLEAFRSPAHGT